MSFSEFVARRKGQRHQKLISQREEAWMRRHQAEQEEEDRQRRIRKQEMLERVNGRTQTTVTTTSGDFLADRNGTSNRSPPRVTIREEEAPASIEESSSAGDNQQQQPPSTTHATTDTTTTNTHPVGVSRMQDGLSLVHSLLQAAERVSKAGIVGIDKRLDSLEEKRAVEMRAIDEIDIEIQLIKNGCFVPAHERKALEEEEARKKAEEEEADRRAELGQEELINEEILQQHHDAEETAAREEGDAMTEEERLRMPKAFWYDTELEKGEIARLDSKERKDQMMDDGTTGGGGGEMKLRRIDGNNTLEKRDRAAQTYTSVRAEEVSITMSSILEMWTYIQERVRELENTIYNRIEPLSSDITALVLWSRRLRSEVVRYIGETFWLPPLPLPRSATALAAVENKKIEELRQCRTSLRRTETELMGYVDHDANHVTRGMMVEAGVDAVQETKIATIQTLPMIDEVYPLARDQHVLIEELLETIKASTNFLWAGKFTPNPNSKRGFYTNSQLQGMLRYDIEQVSAVKTWIYENPLAHDQQTRGINVNVAVGPNEPKQVSHKRIETEPKDFRDLGVGTDGTSEEIENLKKTVQAEFQKEVDELVALGETNIDQVALERRINAGIARLPSAVDSFCGLAGFKDAESLLVRVFDPDEDRATVACGPDEPFDPKTLVGGGRASGSQGANTPPPKPGVGMQRVKQLEEKLELYENENTSLRVEVERLKDEVSDLSPQIDELRQLRSDHDELVQVEKNLRTDFELQSKNFEGLREELEAQSIAVIEARKQLATEQRQLAEESKELDFIGKEAGFMARTLSLQAEQKLSKEQAESFAETISRTGSLLIRAESHKSLKTLLSVSSMPSGAGGGTKKQLSSQGEVSSKLQQQRSDEPPPSLSDIRSVLQEIDDRDEVPVTLEKSILSSDGKGEEMEAMRRESVPFASSGFDSPTHLKSPVESDDGSSSATGGEGGGVVSSPMNTSTLSSLKSPMRSNISRKSLSFAQVVEVVAGKKMQMDFTELSEREKSLTESVLRRKSSIASLRKTVGQVAKLPSRAAGVQVGPKTQDVHTVTNKIFTFPAEVQATADSTEIGVDCFGTFGRKETGVDANSFPGVEVEVDATAESREIAILTEPVLFADFSEPKSESSQNQAPPQHDTVAKEELEKTQELLVEARQQLASAQQRSEELQKEKNTLRVQLEEASKTLFPDRAEKSMQTETNAFMSATPMGGATTGGGAVGFALSTSTVASTSNVASLGGIGSSPGHTPTKEEEGRSSGGGHLSFLAFAGKEERKADRLAAGHGLEEIETQTDEEDMWYSFLKPEGVVDEETQLHSDPGAPVGEKKQFAQRFTQMFVPTESVGVDAGKRYSDATTQLSQDKKDNKEIATQSFIQTADVRIQCESQLGLRQKTTQTVIETKSSSSQHEHRGYVDRPCSPLTQIKVEELRLEAGIISSRRTFRSGTRFCALQVPALDPLLKLRDFEELVARLEHGTLSDNPPVFPTTNRAVDCQLLTQPTEDSTTQCGTIDFGMERAVGGDNDFAATHHVHVQNESVETKDEGTNTALTAMAASNNIKNWKEGTLTKDSDLGSFEGSQRFQHLMQGGGGSKRAHTRGSSNTNNNNTPSLNLTSTSLKRPETFDTSLTGVNLGGTFGDSSKSPTNFVTRGGGGDNKTTGTTDPTGQVTIPINEMYPGAEGEDDVSGVVRFIPPRPAEEDEEDLLNGNHQIDLPHHHFQEGERDGGDYDEAPLHDGGLATVVGEDRSGLPPLPSLKDDDIELLKHNPQHILFTAHRGPKGSLVSSKKMKQHAGGYVNGATQVERRRARSVAALTAVKDTLLEELRQKEEAEARRQRNGGAASAMPSFSSSSPKFTRARQDEDESEPLSPNLATRSAPNLKTSSSSSPFFSSMDRTPPPPQVPHHLEPLLVTEGEKASGSSKKNPKKSLLQVTKNRHDEISMNYQDNASIISGGWMREKVTPSRYAIDPLLPKQAGGSGGAPSLPSQTKSGQISKALFVPEQSGGNSGSGGGGIGSKIKLNNQAFSDFSIRETFGATMTGGPPPPPVMRSFQKPPLPASTKPLLTTFSGGGGVNNDDNDDSVVAGDQNSSSVATASRLLSQTSSPQVKKRELDKLLLSSPSLPSGAAAATTTNTRTTPPLGGHIPHPGIGGQFGAARSSSLSSVEGGDIMQSSSQQQQLMSVNASSPEYGDTIGRYRQQH